MKICPLNPITNSLITIQIIFFIQLLTLMIVIENSPLVPILTAIATSAVGLFQIQIDTLHIAKYIRDASYHTRNRGAFVRDLLYTAFYRSGQGYNVIVFNLAEDHRQRLYGVTFYGSVAFSDRTRFGIWVFEYGTFENLGARGWHNWGMIGSFKKSKDGSKIFFHRRHRLDRTTITTTTISTLAPSTENITNININTNVTNIATNNPIPSISTSTSTSTTEISLTNQDLQNVLENNNNKLFKIDNAESKNESSKEPEEKKITHKIKIQIEDKRNKNWKKLFESSLKKVI